jgi:hypothetical protein
MHTMFHRLNPMHLLTWRIAVRIDVRRALLAMGGVGGALALVFFFVIHKPAENIVEQGFGYEWRTGSILVVPPAGDVCQQSVFDNDNGMVWPLDPIACAEVIRGYDKTSKADTSPGHVEAISQSFRK